MQERNLIAGREKILDQALTKSMMKLRMEVGKVVAAVAQEKHYAAIFTQDAMVIPTPQLDITDEVIARTNQQVKKIPVDWAAADGGDTGAAKAKK
jgi:Skp family chaperone for outer membrane proteins